VQRFQYRGGHGKHTGVAGRYHHNPATAGGQLEGMGCTLQLLAVVAAVADLAWP